MIQLDLFIDTPDQKDGQQVNTYSICPTTGLPLSSLAHLI